MNATEEHAGTEHLHKLLAKFHTAMLVTRTPEGELRGRPMAIVKIEDDCRVWFFTANRAGKVHEIEDDSQVVVTCQDEHSTYLSISGRARVTSDREKISELWRDSFKAWFPEGKDDPEIALICIEPEEGEYWDNEGFNRVKYLFETAKALATGSKPRVREGEQHAKVSL